MNHILEDILMHYGVGADDGAPGRGSGRYPKGSGKNPYQRPSNFLDRYEKYKKEGKKETEIAEIMGLSTTQLRAHVSLAKNEQRMIKRERALELRDQGMSLNDIAKEMGFKNDSSVRSLLNEETAARKNKAQTTADLLKKIVEEKGMIDVGAGVEIELGISQEKMRQALALLEAEGYPVYGGGVPQVTNPGKQTNRKVLCPPGTEWKEIYDFDKVQSLTEYTSDDGGATFRKLQPPSSLDSKRIMVRYAEDGGTEMDGVIELRRGVQDLSLGNSHYAQVRIMVDGTHYLKGMAVYSDDLPDGVDVRFNTNKHQGTPMCGPKNNSVLKNIKTEDPDNPFGALIKASGQYEYEDAKGNKHLSPINKTREEGDWQGWSHKLPSQFLSKQPWDLAKRQIDLTIADKKMEFAEICSLENPTIKKHFLRSFADSCDSDAVHLQMAALPRQQYQVLLPGSYMKDNEIYAPNFKPGEQVALVRFPHAGSFEIPLLRVNNKVPEAEAMIGKNAKDAVVINSKVAGRLSGADFDGDTVMVIPTKGIHIKSSAPLEGLKDFDPKETYGGKPEGTFRVMRNTQTEMGKISNLITDMQIKGATDDELARAVRHSMVVIDAEKHRLDYKQSEVDNNIKELKELYQRQPDGRAGGASTLISRAKSETSVPKTRGSGHIDPDTGEMVYKLANETYVDKNGHVQTRTQRSTQMADTKDARTLSSGHPMENLYADYANTMKAMGNTARKEILSTGNQHYSASARNTYKDEFDSLETKLRISESNAPRERQAQSIANSKVKAMKVENPGMTKEEEKKASQRALTDARIQVGAKRTTIDITDREWEAIQAGAVSENQLTRILRYADTDNLRERAMPRSNSTVSDAKVNKIQAMKASGYTNTDIAEAVGLSTTTVSKYL